MNDFFGLFDINDVGLIINLLSIEFKLNNLNKLAKRDHPFSGAKSIVFLRKRNIIKLKL